MSIQYLEAFAQQGQVISKPPKSSKLILVLHGLGASAQDFYPLLAEYSEKLDSPLKGVFPQAPTRPVTINQGYKMPSWYDILGFHPARKVDLSQVKASVKDITDLLAQEHKKGIAYEDMILAGFSQGGAIALETSLKLPHTLAGVLAMSTYLFEPESLKKACEYANGKTPYLIQHGTQDPVVQFELGKSSFSAFKKAGFQVEFQDYPMQHEVCLPQIQAKKKWIAHCFSQ